MHKRIDGIELQRLYTQEELTPTQIAQRMNFSVMGIDGALRRFGIPRRYRSILPTSYGKREAHPNWKGGRHINSQGYVLVLDPEHPHTTQSGYVREHILIWEKTHNKPLPKGWVIHHLNGIKNDNRPQNLVAMPLKSHSPKLLEELLKKRIRELECEIKLLEKSLQNNQLIWDIGEMNEN